MPGLPATPSLPRQSALVIVTLMACLLGWLWPIGLGGQMPLGGDVTQFFLGLMEVLWRSLKGGQLPVWNDLWGYGFPGLGESQMGVYYPPHLVLYGLLPVEQAYVGSLVLHTLWAGLGGWWAARRFGVSAIGAGLAGFVYAASGFFVIHMPHPWGYTTGAWLPWALGLGWSILQEPSDRRPRSFLVLSLILVLQILPGHFQIAFMTQLALLLMAGWALVEAKGSRLAWGLSPALAGCTLLALPLAALQVWPTARLARLASTQRDFEYLSGFASTPLHLVSLVAPGLFHRSPLWRPLVWDPFHTSPEEMLAYVGLAPLFLALLAAWRGLRGDRGVRTLVLLALISLVLSLGPYIPGFRALIVLPGFSFFRAPARWSVLFSLAMAILGGIGLDRCREWPRAGRGLFLLTGCAAVWIGLVVGLVELALAAHRGGGMEMLAGAFDSAFRSRPWSGDPGFAQVLGLAGRNATDPRIPPDLLASGVASPPADPRSFRQKRLEIYGAELGETAGVLAVLAGLSVLASFESTRRWLPAGLLLLTVVDLGLLGRHRQVSVGPLRPLTAQSSVLDTLSREPRGTRVADDCRNLAMLVGLEPISSYRTLDLPALETITRVARGPLQPEYLRHMALRAMRATGTSLRVLGPVEVAQARRPEGQVLDDPLLARCLFGDAWNQEQPGWGSKFEIVRPGGPAAIAWFVPDRAVPKPGLLDAWDGAPEPILALLDAARPLSHTREGLSRVEVAVDTSEPGWVLVTQLADPQWRANWTEGEPAGSLEAAILPTLRRRRGDGGWQRVRVSGPGRGTLHLEYDAADVRQGLAISAGTWLAWAGLILLLEIRGRRKRGSG